MDFTEHELHALVTAVADQRTYWNLRRKEAKCARDAARTAHEFKLNDDLHKKLLAALLAIETAEKL